MMQPGLRLSGLALALLLCLPPGPFRIVSRADRIVVYHRFIRENIAMELPELARSLILAEGCGMPEKLFMALYTVREHLRFIERGETPGI